MSDHENLGPRGGRTTRTAGGLVRKAWFVRDDQAAALRRLAYERELSESELVRDALDLLPGILPGGSQ